VFFGTNSIKLGTNVGHTSTSDYRYKSNQMYPIWPPNPRWPPYDCSYLGIHQYKTPYCSHNSMKLHAYVLYVPCDTLQIISYINVSKMAAKYIMATKNSMYRINHFHICMSTIHIPIKKYVNIVCVYSS
jgi:hypothetical protein